MHESGVLGPMKGGQSVECQYQIFGNVGCRLEKGSVECRLYIRVLVSERSQGHVRLILDRYCLHQVFITG